MHRSTRGLWPKKTDKTFMDPISGWMWSGSNDPLNPRVQCQRELQTETEKQLQHLKMEDHLPRMQRGGGNPFSRKLLWAELQRVKTKKGSAVSSEKRRHGGGRRRAVTQSWRRITGTRTLLLWDVWGENKTFMARLSAVGPLLLI